MKNHPAVSKVILSGIKKVGLKLLNGLGGSIREIYNISRGVSRGIEPRMVAMDRVGDANWGEFVKTFDRGFYILFSRLLEAVKSLHELGFIHADLNIDNVRVIRKHPEFYDRFRNDGQLRLCDDEKIGHDNSQNDVG